MNTSSAFPQRLARQVPDRAIDAGDGFKQRLPVAAGVGQRKHLLQRNFNRDSFDIVYTYLIVLIE
ncbi:MAG: hypothetical protein K2Y16_12870 [Burkholderiales bacterium]|nr:hypothetical protein [Burkholderiales bacterium]